MNSLQKQIIRKDVLSNESPVTVFERNLLLMKSVNDVEILMKKLQYLGLHFDPFQSEVEKECQQIIDQLGLSNEIKNPYLATNILLRLLDKTEERLNNLKQ